MPGNFWKRLWEKLRKDWLIELILLVLLSVLIIFIRRSFDISILWDFLVSLIFTLFLFSVIYTITIIVEDKLHFNYIIRLDFDEKLRNTEKTKPLLAKNNKQKIKSILESLEDIQNDKPIVLDQFQLYNEILFCAENFTKNMYSIDRDLSAWKNLCIIDDFKILKSNSNASDKEKLETIEIGYFRDLEKQRRIDYTYNINKKVNEAIKEKPIGSVKRLLVIDQEEDNLLLEEKLTLVALTRVMDASKNSIKNRVIFYPNASNEIKEKLDDLFDVVIFDNEVAFQEKNGISYIITQKEKVILFYDTFNELFKKGSRFAL